MNNCKTCSYLLKDERKKLEPDFHFTCECPATPFTYVDLDLELGCEHWETNGGISEAIGRDGKRYSYPTEEAPETDATPIDVETFDGDVFSDALNAWVVEAAYEMDFTPDYDEIASDYMDEREDFNFTFEGVETGKHEYGSIGWNECVRDFWNDKMDADDKAHYIIKKDSEDKK